MTDIAIRYNAGTSGHAFDWGMLNWDLQTDEGMTTAVILSLFSDRLAELDDVLPDNSGDRRGWWADVYAATVNGKPDLLGSRLWLLSRAKATVENGMRAQQYAAEALQWFLDDGVAGEVNATAAYINAEDLKVSINIIRANSTVNHRYDFVWNPQIPATIRTMLAPYIGTGVGGAILGTETGDAFTLF